MNNTLLKSPRSLFKIEIPIIKKENDPFHFNLELEPIQKNTMFPSERALLTKEGNRQSLLELPMETFQQPTDNGHRSSMLQIFTLPLVKKAVQQLKAGLIYSNASPLDEKNAQFINDQAHNPKPEEKFPKIKNPVIRRVFLDASMVINKVNSLPVFGPYDNFRLLWDCLNFLAIFFLIFWIPVEIGFTTHLPTIYYSFFLIIFIIDIFLNMNTAYHMNGYLINDRILIYSNYVKNYLVFDLLSCVLFWLKQNEDLENSVELKNTSLFFFQWIFFLRIQNFKVIYGRFLERIYSKFNIRDSYIDLVNLIFTSMFILHIFACCWHFLAQYNGFVNYENTWMTKLDIDKKTIAVRYMYSLYWSSVTIMTVGYGDISPQNNSEVLFAIIAVCVGCAVTAYIISSLSTIANEFNKEGQIYKQNLLVMNKFMNRKNINSELQMKIRQYLRFIWQEELTQNSEMEEGIIAKLSKTLRDELITEANGHILYKYSMFYANYSQQFLQALVDQIKEARFIPGDLIFSENEIDENEIFFLIKGNIQISTNSIDRYDKKTKMKIASLKKGAVFGELGFFTGQTRTVSAYSKDFTSILYIKREDFIKTLKKFPNDYERYCAIKDQLLLESNYKAINLNCVACKQYNHLAINCPLLHYNKDYYLQKEMQRKENLRRPFKRKKPKDLNAKAEIQIIQKMTMDFQEKDIIYDSPLPKIHKPQYFLKEFENYEENYEKINFLKPLEGNLNDRNFEENKYQNIKINKEYDENNLNKFVLTPLQLSVPPSPSMLDYDRKRNLMNNQRCLKKEEFDKMHYFEYYFPRFNHKKLQKIQKKCTIHSKDLMIKHKLLNFFLEKDSSQVRSVEEMVRKYEKLLDLKNFFVKQSKLTKTFYFEDVEHSKGVEAMSFFNLVYEVLTNDRLRKKLSFIKYGAVIQKKLKKKNVLI